MKVKLYDGLLDGLEVDVPEPLPKFLEVDTGRGGGRNSRGRSQAELAAAAQTARPFWHRDCRLTS
jgi:hypothetical protein